MSTKKTIKKLLTIGFIIGFIAIFSVILYIGVIFITSPVHFNKNKITDSKLFVSIYDSENRPIEHTYLNGEYISLKLLPSYTKQSFLSIEDKNFYKHNGLNYKRIITASVKNLMSLSFKEGASTISQQLIKNTHLSNDKTIKRKINEIKLTLELENSMTKDEIFEYYLNVIYFGDNCYGIQNASEHYFSHPATKLTLDESALLAGLIKSPNRFHPIKQYEQSIKRRNLVLSEMLRDGEISMKEYYDALNSETIINVKNNIFDKNDYASAVIDEAEKILKMPEKQIAINGYRIHTYMNKEKQLALENSIPNDIKEDVSMISINSKTGSVEAYAQKSNINLINIKRQPASAIKPVLVYAPAVNENIISPSTIILDDAIDIGGYEPQNIGGKHYGYVSATYSLAQSLNIPAVKILSYVGIERAKGYLLKQGFDFSKDDNNLAIALGGMTYGVTLKELTNTYQTLANYGDYVKSNFIKYIISDTGKIIYKDCAISKKIYRDDTSYLITKMLAQSTKIGTAKRMSDLGFFVASKTGTSSVSKENIDAYNISYTTDDVVGCWIGNLDNTPTEIVGGGAPTLCVKQYFNQIYRKSKPKEFNMPSSIVEIEIDELKLNNDHTVVKANDYLPERFRKKAIFSRFNMPKEQYFEQLTIVPTIIDGIIKNGVAQLSFNATEYCIYEIYRIENYEEKLINEISCKNGKTSVNVDIMPNVKNVFYVKTKIKNYRTGETIFLNNSNEIELIIN